jgi:PAS domain S-box-containing protein
MRERTFSDEGEDHEGVRNRGLELLSDVGVRLLTHDQPEELIPGLLERLAELLRLDVVLGYLADRRTGQLRLHASCGLRPAERQTSEVLRFGEAMCAAVAQARHAAIVDDGPNSSEVALTVIHSLGLCAYACHPLIAEDQLLGTFAIGRREGGPFRREELALLRTASEQVATSLRLRRLVATLRQEVSDRQRAEERVRLAVAAAGMGFWDWDIAQDVFEWDPTHNRLLGLPPDQRRGTSVRLLARVHREDRAAVRAALEAAAQGRDCAAEFRVTTGAGGEVRWLSTRGRVLLDGQGRAVRLIGATLDVTERKRSEEQRREQQAQLEEALRRAEAASLAKDHFLATLSHELRTPLTPVLMVSAEAAADDGLPRDIRDTFQTVHKNVVLEARLIDDLLDLTRITRGKLSLDRQVVDLHEVVRDAIATVEPDLSEKRIVVTTEWEAQRHQVDADPVRLQQVFWNILRNAAKFTPRLGRIFVRTRNAGGGRSVCVDITDTGIGLTPEEVARIFDAFAQGDHAGRRPGTAHPFGGLGLGLAISQRLTQMHGGRIYASSGGRGRGATFTVELATALRPTETLPDRATGREGVRPQPSGLQILLVEDHESTRDALTMLLRRRRHQVCAAANGAEALELARAEPFDLVISDIGLPDIDGHALLARLRELQPGLLAIALSGWGMEEDIRRSSSAGFSRHLVKPVEVPKLEEAISSAFAVRDSNIQQEAEARSGLAREHLG